MKRSLTVEDSAALMAFRSLFYNHVTINENSLFETVGVSKAQPGDFPGRNAMVVRGYESL